MLLSPSSPLLHNPFFPCLSHPYSLYSPVLHTVWVSAGEPQKAKEGLSALSSGAWHYSSLQQLGEAIAVQVLLSCWSSEMAHAERNQNLQKI